LKPSIKNLFPCFNGKYAEWILRGLIASLGWLIACPAMAQNFTTLHTFTNGSDGAYPVSRLIQSGNTLYGTAASGGTSGNGTVFAINIRSGILTPLHTFTATVDASSDLATNGDGVLPVAGLILSGDTLYGTAENGGTNGYGTVFAVNTNGTVFTNLHSFDFFDGAYPAARLILSGNTLYGTTAYGGRGGGGPTGSGTVFAINTNGMCFTNLYNFGEVDGAQPVGELILSNITLYGTTAHGGTNGYYGTVFAVNTNGMCFTNLHSFSEADGSPYAGLILSDNMLYGTTSDEETGNVGMVFAVNTNGMCVTNLHSFTGGSDGGYPFAGLILSGNTLYGTASNGGTNSYGTAFEIQTNGTGFTTLHNFTDGSDGGDPQAELILSGNTLYGTAAHGGSGNNGTVFSLSFSPQLGINLFGANVILTWPTNVDGFDCSGFTLQYTTNLPSLDWTTNSPGPAIVNGQYTVTNSISGTQRFYRLSQ